MTYDAIAYSKAYDAHSAAFNAFDAVRLLYRAGKVDDAAFMAARKEYNLATTAYDEAYSLAQYQGYYGPKA